MSSLCPLHARVARDVLFFRPCKLCQSPFLYCRRREPGRLYCNEPCSTRARQERERKARRKYRESADGRDQHRDEEAERRERRRLERVGDRRCALGEGQLQTPAATAARQSAVEERGDGPGQTEGEGVEWVLVTWPRLRASAERLLGEPVACSCCGRRGTVVQVVDVGRWRRRGLG